MYNFKKYVTKNRWIDYWHQLNETISLSPDSVLEVGIGNKIVYNCLKAQGLSIFSLDIDPGLNPDCIGSVLGIPFRDESFDVILCAQVLEHLPFDKFKAALDELHRVTKRNLILSLPHTSEYIKLNFKFPSIKENLLVLKFPFSFKNKKRSRQHRWEIGLRAFSLIKVKRTIGRFFRINRSFISEGGCGHRFFILEKKPIKDS